MKTFREAAGTLIPDVLAGITSGLVTLVYSLSFAALIFSGKLAVHFPEGAGIALVGATVTAILVAWRSPFPFTLAGPEANSAVILAMAAASIAGALGASGREASIFPTVWATLILGTASTGLALYLLGRFRWGRFARFIPYPVIGGFLAGTGWLITRSSFKVMTGIPLGISGFRDLLGGGAVVQWGSGALFTVLLWVVLRRSRHFLTLPALLLGGVVLGNVVRIGLKHFAPAWNSTNGFFEPFSQANVWRAWDVSTVTAVDWPVLMHQGGTLVAMMLIVVLSILLNSTGLELATSRNVDLDQELRANGIANLANGFCGGMVGYLSINRCLLNQQAGARTRRAGMIAGGVCGGSLLFGSSFLAYVPKPVLGGLLLYIGTNLLFRWICQAWSQFPRVEYALIVTILVVIGMFGFLQGVGAGILISCLLFILNYGKTSSIKYTLSGSRFRSNVSRSGPQLRLLEEDGDAITVLVLHGYLFFGTANDLLEGVRHRLAAGHRRALAHAIFDFRLVTGLDSSAVLSFVKLRQMAGKAGLNLVFTQMSPPIEESLRRGGLFASGGPGPRCFADLDRGLEWCEDLLLGSRGGPGVLPDSLESQLLGLLGDATSAVGMLPYFQAVEMTEGEVLFRQGEPADGLYFLESGRVSVMVELSPGRTLRRRTYTGGTILGEMGFYSGAPRSASVGADQPSRLHYLSREAFRRMETEAPDLASCFHRGVVNLVAERLRRSEEEVRSLLQ